MDRSLSTVGRTELIQLADYGSQVVVLAKVDTGADLSCIWASDVSENDGVLSFVLFDKDSPYYTGETIRISRPDYRPVRIANSFGHKERRYVVKIRIRINGRLIRAAFSLADRREKKYPVLIGRKLLHKKFLVDVSRVSADQCLTTSSPDPLISQTKDHRIRSKGVQV